MSLCSFKELLRLARPHAHKPHAYTPLFPATFSCQIMNNRPNPSTPHP
jgi:hypothetical protein